MKVLTQGLKWESFLGEVGELTDDNNHAQARVEIAEYFDLEKYEKIFKLISEIHMIERGMPSDLMKYRYALTNEMLEFIKKNYSKEVYTELYNSL